MGALQVILPGHPPGYLGLAILPSGLFGLDTLRVVPLAILPSGLFGLGSLRVVLSGLFGLGTLWVIFQPGHPPGYFDVAIVSSAWPPYGLFGAWLPFKL